MSYNIIFIYIFLYNMFDKIYIYRYIKKFNKIVLI